jgi:hypothetical protein
MEADHVQRPEPSQDTTALPPPSDPAWDRAAVRAAAAAPLTAAQREMLAAVAELARRQED